MRGGFMTNPSSGQARDPVEKLTRAQLIKRLREAQASLDAVHDGSDLKSTKARLAEEIEARARAEGDFQLALDAAGMGSWELLVATGAINDDLAFMWDLALPLLNGIGPAADRERVFVVGVRDETAKQ